MARTVHIIGAGLAGLAAAVKLAPSPLNIVVHEATAYPGGRCRSYFDRTIGMTIDNGNHLVLSGNHAVLDFAKAVGSAAHLIGPETAEFTFVDLSSSERWRLRISDGLPWWIFDPSRRVPGTRLGEYLRLARLLWAKGDVPLADAIECSGPLYQRLIHPVLLAALNIEPREGSAALAAAVVRETLATGGKACRPLIARDGLGPTFIEPAIEHLRQRNVEMRLDDELRALRMDGDRIAELDFGGDTTFDKTRLREAFNRVTGYTTQYYSGSAWVDIISGRALTRLMSPLRTLKSWGSSSRLVLRMNPPIGVRRGSALIL